MRELPHAILLSGEIGTGKKTLARTLAGQILRHPNMDTYPYFLQIAPVKNTIGIEAIRDVRSFLGRKTTGQAEVRRIVLIGDAHTMTSEAQNALLKSLEEPPSDTIIMMTASDLNLLKATILSRSQHTSVRPISKDYALEVLTGHDQKALASAYYMSGGRIGLLKALLEQKTDHVLVGVIDQAKALLGLTTYERLLLADGLSKQKDELNLLLDGLQCVASSGLAQAALKNNAALTKKFHALNQNLLAARENIRRTANAKLALSHLFLSM